MLNNKVAIDAPEVLPLTRDLLAKMKKQDMQQAVFERFSARKRVAPRVALQTNKRSPYWQPRDEEC